MAPVLRPADLLSQDQIDAVAQSAVLTAAQLHQLRQQIDALRRINVQLRVLKYRARTGQEPPSRAEVEAATLVLSSRGGRGRGRGGRGRGSAGAGLLVGGGRGRGRGQGRGTKRGREDEEEEDDSIVVNSSEEEDGEEAANSGSGSGSDDGGGEEDEEMASADSEESEEDFELPVVASPRRTGRARRPSQAVAETVSVSSGEDGEGGDGEAREPAEAAPAPGREEQQAQAPAGPEVAGAGEEAEVKEEARDSEPGGGAAAAGRGTLAGRGGRGAGKAEGGGGGGGGRGGGRKRGLFMVVADTPATSKGAPLQLPQLKPVVPGLRRKRSTQGEEAAEEEGEEEEQEEEETECSVCFDGEAPEDNVILLCEGKGCNVAVHQHCYGVREVPEGEWLCDACKAKLKPTDANCCVCPAAGFAVRKVTSLGRVVPAASKAKGKGRGRGAASSAPYCHLACAIWVPELELEDRENLAGVKLDRLTAARVKLRCELCKQAGGGAVQCVFDTCMRSFHVLCAWKAGQQLQFRVTDGETLPFCGLHSKPAFEKLVEDMVDGKRPLGEPTAAAEQDSDGDA